MRIRIALLIFFTTVICSCSGTFPGPLPAATTTVGPLRVLPANPRYFTDDKGKPIYLTGVHDQNNLQTLASPYDALSSFDFDQYLQILQQSNHNFVRGWIHEDAGWVPNLYLRTGPGKALDGQPKFDLTKFDQTYFDRLRTRVIKAGQKGIFMSVMLFNGWSVTNSFYARKVDVWAQHPFNAANNINGVNGDLNGDGEGPEIHTLSVPQFITSLQELYVTKVIDTVGDLDNVLFEISNESKSDSLDWQFHMIHFIRDYESAKGYKQHSVGMTSFFDSQNAPLFASPADWISPSSHDPNGPSYSDNPAAADGSKVVIADTDHIGVKGEVSTWIWKAFTRGLNPVHMDSTLNGFNVPGNIKARAAMGYAKIYADNMDLAAMTPQGALSSTHYALANPGSEYFVYQPEANTSFTVTLLPGTYIYEWFDPTRVVLYPRGSFSATDATSWFTAPFSGEAILYLKKAAVTHPPG